MILIILGVVLGVCTLSFLHEFSLLGSTCFYVGELSPSSTCIPPFIYYAAFGAAALLILGGVVQLIKPSKP